MTSGTFLSDDVLGSIEKIGQADLLVGIPSYNNAGTISHVVKMAAEGAKQHFPGMRAVVLNSDGGSTDGTPDVVMGTPVPEGVDVLSVPYTGISGKGSSFRTLFEVGRRLGVKVCVVVDSDLRSITPGWIKLLAGPVLKEGYGYVTPYYVRHKNDATITNNIVYPMTRMLYGRDIRQPIGGDFGFSAALLDHYLGQDVWETDIARYGIDIWMTTTAVNEGFAVCQSHLGAKIHDAKDPAESLGPMFRQVVGTLFRLMSTYEENWKQVRGSEEAPRCGTPVEIEPEPVAASLDLMLESLWRGEQEWGGLWDKVLSRENMEGLRHVVSLKKEEYHFAAELWARVIYDYAVMYNKGDVPPQPLMDSMTPLYLGRVASNVVEGADMDSDTFEIEVVQKQAVVFEETKPYLVGHWEG